MTDTADRDAQRVESRVAAVVGRGRRLLRATVSYVLFGAAIVALHSFFAPVFDAPTLRWWAAVVPPVTAPTETEGVVVNVTPAVVGAVTASVAVWLR